MPKKRGRPPKVNVESEVRLTRGSSSKNVASVVSDSVVKSSSIRSAAKRKSGGGGAAKIKTAKNTSKTRKKRVAKGKGRMVDVSDEPDEDFVTPDVSNADLEENVSDVLRSSESVQATADDEGSS